MLSFIQHFDESILLWIQENIRTPWLTAIMQFCSLLFDRGLLSIATCVVLLFFKKTRTVGYAATGSLVLCSIITNLTLKPFFARTRPYHLLNNLITLTHQPHDYSFPSGHTTAAFAVASILFFCFPKKYGTPALFLAILVGLSRIYLGVHFPSDVAAGAFIGLFVGYLVSKLWQRKTLISKS